MNNTSQTFNILDHIDKLTPAKEKGRYICPECSGHNLTIGKDGAYQCWNGCECKDIREAIAPRDFNNAYLPTPVRPVKDLKAKPKSMIAIPATQSIQLVMLTNSTVDTPQVQKRADKEHGEVWVTTYKYSPSQWVERLEWTDSSKFKGRDKKFKQWHRDANGQAICKKGFSPWLAYRIDEALAAVKAIEGTPALLHLEGEKNVEIGRLHSIASVTFQGSTWDSASLERHFTQLKNEHPSAIAVMLQDNDRTGHNKAKAFLNAAASVGVIAVIIDPVAIYPDIPDKGDIEEILATMDAPEFIKRLEEEIHQALSDRLEEQKRSDPDERLKLDLHALLKEPDPIKRMRQRAEICSHYRLKASDIAEALKHLEQQTLTPQKTWFTFDEFFNQESDEIQYVVPKFLPRGETLLLAAQAKCGKTALATDIMYAVLSGGVVLGEQVGIKGKVLLISSDESPNSTRRRMRARGFDLLEERSNFRLMTHLDITNLSELESRLEEQRPDLVVIDSLTTICLELGISEKDPEYAHYIYKLKALLGRYNAACILTHHENKDPLAKGINQVSGSARIPAAVWGILQLKAVDPNNDADPRRWLKVKPREGEATTFNLEMNPSGSWLHDGIWSCQGEVGDTGGEKKTQGDRVLQLLRKVSPQELTYQEIDSALSIGKSLYQVLDRLENRHLVTKRRSETNSRTWIYSVKNDEKKVGDTPPPPVDPDCIVEYSETTASSELQQFNTQFNTNSTPIQQSSAVEEVLNCSNPYAATNSTPIQQIDDVGGGEGVENNVEAASTPVEMAAVTNSLLDAINPSPSPEELAVQISYSQTWAEALRLIDHVAVAQNLKRRTVLRILFTKAFSQSEQSRFIALLDLHLVQNPEDSRALKALELLYKHAPESFTGEAET